MQKKKNKQKKKVNIKKFIVFLAFFVLFLSLAYRFIHQHYSLSVREKLETEYQEKISEAKLKNEQLEKELENSKSDEYLEKMAREKLGLVKPNERVFVDVTKD